MDELESLGSKCQKYHSCSETSQKSEERFLLMAQKSGETVKVGSLSQYLQRILIHSPGGTQFPTNFVLKPFHLDVSPHRFSVQITGLLEIFI